MKYILIVLAAFFLIQSESFSQETKGIRHYIEFNPYSYYFFSANAIDEYGNPVSAKGGFNYETGLRYVLKLNKVFGFTLQSSFQTGRTAYKTGLDKVRAIGSQNGMGLFLEVKDEWMYFHSNAGLSYLKVPELEGDIVTSTYIDPHTGVVWGTRTFYQPGFKSLERVAPFVGYGIGFGWKGYFYFDHVLTFQEGVKHEFRIGTSFRFEPGKKKYSKPK